MEELPDVIADNRAAMAAQLGTGDKADKQEISRVIFSKDMLDILKSAESFEELNELRHEFTEIAAKVGKKTAFEKYIANTIKETSKRIKQLMKEEQQAEIAERTLQEKERLKERFPFIVSHEKKDGTTAYSVQPQLLAEHVRKHDRYFFLDTGGDKPPIFLYESGCYYRVSDNAFKGIIRKHIEAFDGLLAIPPEKRDRKLRERIHAECEGVAYKAVMALRTFRARGGDFIVPAACRFATEEYKIENDAIRRFCEENTRKWKKCEPIYKDPCTAAVIYRAYKNWASSNGEYILSHSEFRAAIAEIYGNNEQSIVMKQRGNIYYPFTLKNSARIEYTGYKCDLSEYEQEQNSP